MTRRSSVNRKPFSASLAILGSLTAAALGLPYVTYAFGPTEAEVADWGQITFYIGLGLAILAVVGRRLGYGFMRVLLAIGMSALALMQLPPALLWFVFHNSGISDGTPPSAFVAHWAYALPHIAVAALCLAAVYQLLNAPSRRPGSSSHTK
ncbi:MAG: hypothetical protein ACP5HG_14495 [Anaerolineae bacterium]